MSIRFFFPCILWRICKNRISLDSSAEKEIKYNLLKDLIVAFIRVHAICLIIQTPVTVNVMK